MPIVINVCKKTNKQNYLQKKTLLLVIQCNDINCLNNGTCVTLTTGYYRCSCATGYGGSYCQYSKLIKY